MRATIDSKVKIMDINYRFGRFLAVLCPVVLLALMFKYAYQLSSALNAIESMNFKKTLVILFIGFFALWSLLYLSFVMFVRVMHWEERGKIIKRSLIHSRRLLLKFCLLSWRFSHRSFNALGRSLICSGRLLLKSCLLFCQFSRLSFNTLGRLFLTISHHIRYKYYQCCNLVKNFRLGNDEGERLKLIHSIEKLRNNN